MSSGQEAISDPTGAMGSLQRPGGAPYVRLVLRRLHLLRRPQLRPRHHPLLHPQHHRQLRRHQVF